MRLFLAVILFLFTGLAVHGQPVAPYDSAAVKTRSFDDASVQAYKKDPQFQYDNVKEPVNSAWRRFWKWFWIKVDRLFDSRGGRNTLLIVFLVLLIGGLVYFLTRMTNRSGLFGGEGKGLNYQVGEEDIHSISFEDAIREAVESGNYRLAVRLVYLHSLKLLSDRLLIDWKPGKTNSAYVYELKQHPVHRSFNQLTTEFEFAWYGGEEVSSEHYDEFEASFREFKNHIGQ